MRVGHTHVPHAFRRHAERERIPLSIDLDVLAAPCHPTLWVTGKEASLVVVELLLEECLVGGYHLVADTWIKDVITVILVKGAIACAVFKMVEKDIKAHITQVFLRDCREEEIGKSTLLLRYF